MRKIFLFWSGGVLMAFVVGRYVFPSPDSGITGLSPEVVDAVMEWERQGVGVDELTPGSPIRRRIIRSRTPSEQVARGVYVDLQTADPIELESRILDRLTAVDESNWEEVYAQFSTITRDTGRTHDELWKRMLVRIGQVAGESAMDKWHQEEFKGRGTQATQVIYGWAMKDPDGARRWFENTDGIESGLRRDLFNRLIGGMALTNPERLPEFVGTLPDEEQLRAVGHSVWNLMRGGGIEGTSQWLDEMQGGNWSESLKRRSFDEVAKAVSRTVQGGPGVDLASNWFQQYRDSDFMTSGLIGQAAGKHRLEHSVKGLDFLVETAGFSAMAGQEASPPGLGTVIRNAVDHDPGILERWIEDHDQAPFRNSAIEYYALELERSGDPVKAGEWRALKSE